MNSSTHSDRTRILFICHDAKIYGAQKSLKLIIEHLPRSQFDITVSFPQHGPLVEELQALGDVRILFHKRLLIVKHSKRNLFQRIGDCLGLLLGLPRILPLVQDIKKHRIDLVHSNTLVTMHGALAAKLAGVPHVWHIRESFADYNPRFHLILGKAFTRFLAVHLSNRVLSISRYVQGQFRPERQPQKFQVLHNAIALDNVPMATPGEGPLQVLYLGRLSDGKRFHDLLGAFVLLKQRHGAQMPFRLRAYGEFICPDFERTVRQTLVDAQLEDCFLLHSYEKNIDRCFAQTDLLAMPSSTEAFGRTLLEAMVRGVPVLTANSGAPPEIVQDGVHGFLHEANNPLDLADKLESIYQRRRMLAAMAEPCIDHVQSHFNSQSYISQLLMLYQSLTRSSADVPSEKHHPCWHGS